MGEGIRVWNATVLVGAVELSLIGTGDSELQF
jgi:hypothetical protein